MADAPPRRRRSPTLLALAALVVGLGLGIAADRTGAPALTSLVRVLEPLGALWIAAIRMTLVPLVVALLVRAVAGFDDVRSLGRLGARTALLFVALLVGVSLFAALVAPPLFARMPLDADTAAALRASFAPPGEEAPPLPTLRGFVTGLVPVNPVKAAADGAMLPLIVFTLLFAVATTRLAPAAKASILGLFGAVADAMLVVVRWILALTPLGVLGLTAALGMEHGAGLVGPVAWYVAVTCGMLAACTLLLYVVAAWAGGVSLRTFARAAAPAQAMAIASRSSLASLPALIEGARRAYGDRPAITGFVLPLCVATFKITTPIADLVAPLFLARLYGLELGWLQVATMTLVTIPLSFSNPGIPSGGLFVVSAPVLLAVGLPLDGLALLVAADALPDIGNTVGNVTGDMVVATILAREAPLADGAATPLG
mgnify:CR=1 FL=1